MKDVNTSLTIAVFLAGVIGGAVVKLVEALFISFFNRRSLQAEDRIALRHEAREALIHAEVQRDTARKECDVWRDRYYQLVETANNSKLRIEELEAYLKRVGLEGPEEET